MKRFAFVYKLKIYFNRDIRHWIVKLTQPKLNTEEIICSSYYLNVDEMFRICL